jgi:hypothetical protein
MTHNCLIAISAILVTGAVASAKTITLAWDHNDPAQGYLLTVSQELTQRQSQLEARECPEEASGPLEAGWRTYCGDVACPQTGMVSFILQAGNLSEPSNVLQGHLDQDCHWTPIDEWRAPASAIPEVADTNIQPLDKPYEPAQTTTADGGNTPETGIRPLTRPYDPGETVAQGSATGTVTDPMPLPTTEGTDSAPVTEMVSAPTETAETEEEAVALLDKRIAELQGQLRRVMEYRRHWLRKLRWAVSDADQQEQAGIESQSYVYQRLRAWAMERVAQARHRRQ